MEARIHVFGLVEQPLVRLGVEAWARRCETMVWVGACASWRAALVRLNELPCDIALYSPGLDESADALFVDRAARRAGARVVALLDEPGGRRAAELIRAGAAACVDRQGSLAELADVVHTVHRMGRYVVGPLVDALLAPTEAPAHASLSPREGEVFRRLIAGRRPQAIARELGVAASTVSTHISHIRRKLRVESIAGMVAYAARAGLLRTAS